MPSAANNERLQVTDIGELRSWLAANHTRTDSIWLVTFKKHVPDRYVSRGEVIDEILCWGWIDSLARKIDDDRTMLLISPRKEKSAWSKVNKDKIARLEADDRIQPPGRAKIKAAKANDMWHFLDDVDALIKPDDLIAAFGTVPGSADNFDNFPASSRRGILEWIKQAKQNKTRKRRIDMTAKLAGQNIMANHPESQRQR